MSTSPQISPAWKQEVNRRLAEHRGRKGAPSAEPHLPSEVPHSASQRAQQAAARVAARYANAPSYSEVLAAEARAALRAAEAASRAALEAQAAAQSVLAGIEAAQAAEPRASASAIKSPIELIAAPLGPERGLELVETQVELDPEPDLEFDSELAPWESPADECIEMLEPVLTVEPVEPVSIRWDPDLPLRPIEPAPMYANRGNELFETEWWKLAPADSPYRQASREPAEIEVVEPAQPIPANLIEFPRELVATRKARPRQGETANGEADMQLSIFEVDPREILPAETLPGEIATGPSTAPAPAAHASTGAARTASTWTAPTWTASAWTAPAWSGIELEEQPQQQASESPEEPAPGVAVEPALAPAPASLRLMAMVVDGALIAGSFIGAALLAVTRMSAMPALRTAEIGAIAGLLIAAAAYYVLFFTLARTTPGMLYAQLRLSTFEGCMPTRAQRWTRLAAMLVSVLPVGLGIAWAIFDDDQLCWHDRLSRTYVCRR